MPEQDPCLIYRNRMINYYPNIVKQIEEIQAIVDAEYPEFCELDTEREVVLANAWLSTMDESRILQWEQILHITPLEDSTLQDRRETIAARVYGGYKLNTESIRAIVNIFTQSGCRSYFRDSTIYVIIYPPSGDKTYKFENIENELWRRVPAHLNLNVSRSYSTWGDVNNHHASWNTLYNEYNNWEDVYFWLPEDSPANGGS